jgi:hypothetical protein
MSPMRELLTFLRAVGRHWITLVTGGAVTAGVAVWEHLHGVSVTPRYYGLILGFFLFVACYQAWLRQDRALLTEQEKNSKPKIKLDLREVRLIEVYESLPESQQNECYALLRVHLVNESPVAATVKDYRLRVTAGGRSQPSQPLPSLAKFKFKWQQPENSATFGSEWKTVMEAIPALDKLTSGVPLERGHGYEAWLGFLVKARPADMRGAAITVTISDAFAVEYAASGNPPWSQSDHEIVKTVSGPVS